VEHDSVVLYFGTHLLAFEAGLAKSLCLAAIVLSVALPSP
jgi:hypothetical protein